MSKINSNKWYHYPIVWFMLAIPAVSIVSGLTMLYLGINTPDILETQHVQKRGLVVEHAQHPKKDNAK